MKVDLNAFSPAEFLDGLRGRSSAYLDGICSLNTSKHLVVLVLFQCAFQIILLMCMIALVYLFSLHRTCYSSSYLVPINVSSKNYSFFFLSSLFESRNSFLNVFV